MEQCTERINKIKIIWLEDILSLYVSNAFAVDIHFIRLNVDKGYNVHGTAIKHYSGIKQIRRDKNNMCLATYVFIPFR